MKLTILGGGGFRVPLVYRALSRGRYAGLITDVTLYDADGDRLAAMERVLASMPDGGDDESSSHVRSTAQRPRVFATTDLPRALSGADVVFAAIRAGSTAGRVLDERIAMKHGLLGQETTGAGGLAYALRSIPQMIQLGRAIAQNAPNAWLINFTNPAGMVTEALQPLLGNRIIGICDSPISLVRRASAAAGIPRARATLAGVDYLGLNHLGWLRGLVHDGEDRLPSLLADSGRLASFEEGRIFGPDLPQLLGCLPNEYLFYYYFHREATQAMRTSAQTRGEFIDAEQRELYARLAKVRQAVPAADSSAPPSAKANLGSQPDAWRQWDAVRRAREEGYLAETRTENEDRDESDLAGGGYEQVALAAMQALLLNCPTELILNVRNSGTVSALPDGAVIEVPARIDARGATPLPTAPPTLHQQGLMSCVKVVEQLIIQAAQSGNRNAALEAFTLHPLIDSAHVAQAVLTDYEAAFPSLLNGMR